MKKTTLFAGLICILYAGGCSTPEEWARTKAGYEQMQQRALQEAELRRINAKLPQAGEPTAR